MQKHSVRLFIQSLVIINVINYFSLVLVSFPPQNLILRQYFIPDLLNSDIELILFEFRKDYVNLSAITLGAEQNKGPTT